MTEWRAIPGYEGRYEVSDDGQVRSLDHAERFIHRGVQAVRVRSGRILKQKITKKGYATVVVYCGDGGRTAFVHLLVLLAFVGPRPIDQVGRHLDGVSLHNFASNLAYGTQGENIEDMRQHGTMPVGANHSNSKITDADVIRIRSTPRGALTALAKTLGVSASLVCRIKNGHSWRHVS